MTELKRWIGSDESGKGDYFGPLVTAAVLVDSKSASLLRELGVKDCKRLADSSVKELATMIEKMCPCSVVAIGPAKYNELYDKMRNLNRLLAWGHSRAMENILAKEECDYALADKFGDERFIINALLEKGKKVEVRQQTGAESDMGVAAASILARAEFVHRLAMLSKKYGMKFPKGAAPVVIEAGKTFVRQYGEERLKEVAKVHFKTTSRVLAK